ncbi:MAG: hypothetical protein ONB06_10245 [candidate division KSB1 bacterium]|nr:hypothetical protein [candidate division KSB1 bacterium]
MESTTEKGLGFDPAAFSQGGNATYPFCGTVADSDCVKRERQEGRLSHQMMALVCTRPGQKGFDPSWLRNAVAEPLDEADIEKLPEGSW